MRGPRSPPRVRCQRAGLIYGGTTHEQMGGTPGPAGQVHEQ